MNQSKRRRSKRAAAAAITSSVGVSPDAGKNPEMEPAWDRRTWLVAIPLALVIYAFIPVLDNGFVVWDDDQNFLDNPYFRGLGAAQVKWAWTTFWLGVYQPLAWLLFEAQYVFCQLDPRGYHLTSLLLQVANAVVLYVLTVALLVRCRTDSCLESPWTCSLSAGLATALFAVHPLRVEAVAWASCQPYLPCALFSMLAVLAYLRAFPMDSSPRWGWLVGSFLLFVAALLFKAVAVSLPAVLLILDVYPLRRFGDGPGRWFGASARRVLLEKVPFVMTSLVFMGLAIAAKPQSPVPIEHYDASEGIAQACYAIWFYISKTVLPLDLIAFYPLPGELNWLALPFSLSILATLAITAGLFLLRRRWPGLLAAWLCYLVILAPNSGIIRISDQIAADRYSYMAMLGSVMLAAAGFCRLWRMSSRWRPGAAIGIIAIGLGSAPGSDRHDAEPVPDLARLGNPVDPCSDPWGKLVAPWHTTTWATSLRPGEVRGGGGSFHRGAAAQSRLRRSPQQPGRAPASQGKYEAAEAHFTEALRLNPGYADAHNNLGVAPPQPGEVRGGGGSFRRGAAARSRLRRCPQQPGRRSSSARGSTRRRRLISPRRCGSIPATPMPTTTWAWSSSDQGKYEEAEAHFAEAIRLNPGYVERTLQPGHRPLPPRELRGGEGSFRSRPYGSIPATPEAYNASAMIMAACPEAKFRDGKRAVEFATRACELTKWKNPRILDTLAAAQAEAGDFDAAVSSQKRAIELLTDERQKDDYRSRLVLYQAKRPYREVSPQRAPTEARP